MSLNIKDEGTHRMARQLARLTGESMTAAVGQAVRERLERVRKEKGDKCAGGMAERLLKIGRETAPLWKEPYRSIDHGDLLYDENGLPK
jgi:antitoxin VapB